MNFLLKLTLILCCVWAVAAPYSASAQTNAAIFTVANVAVDVDDKSAESAKSIAMARARRDAWKILLSRLVIASDGVDVEKLASALSPKWVQSVQIRNEKTSPTRYVADVTIAFKPSAVESFLDDRGIPYTTQISPTFLILPVYDRGDRMLLLEADNLWYQAWQKIESSRAYGLVPVKLPLVTTNLDLADVFPSINHEKILQIAAQYGLSQVLVLRAGLDIHAADSGSASRIRITAENISPNIPTQPSETEYEFAPNTALADSFQSAALKFLSTLDSSWKNRVAQNLGPVKSIDVMVPIRDLGQWVNVENRLRGMPEIRKMNLRAIAVGVAQLSLDIGLADGEDLADLFQKYNFSLSEGQQILILQAM